jgi:predicted DNA-binding transcriptional regulator AlpA
MMMRFDDAPEERLISIEEGAELLGVSSRTVLNLPIKHYWLGPRTIRFRLSDVCLYLGMDNPNLQTAVSPVS